MTTELEQREGRAQHGILEFAEEMQAIRDGKLYPNASKNGKPWATYCKERWGMSKSAVETAIAARSVLARVAATRTTGSTSSGVKVGVRVAAAIATLPDPVQDHIIETATGADQVNQMASAARKENKRSQKSLGRDATPSELIKATRGVKAKPKPIKQPKQELSEFLGHASVALTDTREAADIAVHNVLDDVENDYAWIWVEKMEYEIHRVKDRIYKPAVSRDLAKDFAELLGGGHDEGSEL